MSFNSQDELETVTYAGICPRTTCSGFSFDATTCPLCDETLVTNTELPLTPETLDNSVIMCECSDGCGHYSVLE